MSSNKKQLLLFFVGILLIIVTYIIYPRIGEETRDQYLADKKQKEMESSDTTFENIKYEGFDANGNQFEIGSKIAKVKSENPDITYMETVNAYFYLRDGRVVTVKSLFATYNRETNDIFFKDEVVIDDGESQLYSDNLDVVMSSNFVKAYNSVRFSENANWMVADKIEIDLSKKISTISMYTDEQVKIKLKK
jgi:LPS export ABC transporter protein LptC